MDLLFCGAYGAFSGRSGKVALSEDSPLTLSVKDLCLRHVVSSESSEQQQEEMCWYTVSLCRVIALISMVCFNALMLSTFMKALEKRGSLPVTVGTSASNFLLTGILGSIVLGEKVNGTWALGALVIAAGLTLVTLSQQSLVKGIGGKKEKSEEQM